MRLDLSNIINIPGNSKSFDYQPDLGDMDFDCVNGFTEPVRAIGQVKNSAGVLSLEAEISAELDCVCARCLREFSKSVRLHTEVVLVEEAQDEEDPDIYLLDGDYIDLDEVIITEFVLSLDQKILCDEDCKGLCPRCGKDLNDGACDCRPDADPRLAALAQLLDKD